MQLTESIIMKLGVAYCISLILFFIAMFGVARLTEATEPEKLQTTESGIRFSEECKYYVVGSSQGTKYLIKCKNKAEAFFKKDLTTDEIKEFEKRYNTLLISGDLH